MLPRWIAEIDMVDNLIELQARVQVDLANLRDYLRCPIEIAAVTRPIADRDALRFFFWLIDRNELHLCDPLLFHLTDLSRPVEMKTITLELQRLHLYDQAPSFADALMGYLRAVKFVGVEEFASSVPADGRQNLDRPLLKLLSFPVCAPNCVMLMLSYFTEKRERKMLWFFGIWPEDRSTIQWICYMMHLM